MWVYAAHGKDVAGGFSRALALLAMPCLLVGTLVSSTLALGLP